MVFKFRILSNSLKTLIKESKTAFKKAALINPDNEHAVYWSGSIHWNPALTEQIERQEEDSGTED